jgi:tyrosinase
VPVQVATQPRAEIATLKTRESVSQLSADALARLRAAFTALMARPDNRGFQFFASWHGDSIGICDHHNPLFLPWHRGYLYHLELALQDVDPQVTLPWWDWMDEAGVPAAYEADVLAGSEIKPFGVERRPEWPERTTREIAPPGGAGPGPLAPPLRKSVIGGEEVDLYAWMMDSPTYSEFSQRNWRLHDNIHVWIGGTMADPSWAAFDPLFWAHHTMVDRLWRIWQHNHTGALPPDEILDQPMTFARAPALTPRQVLDVKQLGYEYAGQTDSVDGPG